MMVHIAFPSGNFPSDATDLQNDLETIAQNFLIVFPNIKLIYFSSMPYTGYSTWGQEPEPYAYEGGFGVKWAVQDQINGLSTLNWNPANGPVLAPWMSWGPYIWANGLLPRSDGFTWSCTDFINNGDHLNSPGGQSKGAFQVLNFFKTDSTTTPWFLKH
jgi:hypothetical protein